MSTNGFTPTKFSSRRRFLKTAAGTAAGAMSGSLFGLGMSSTAFAETARPPLGTWPKGSQGDTVFVGLGAPLTGPYSPDGVDLKQGYELALDQINKGEGIGAHWDTMAGKKGVLGKKVIWDLGDTETDPNTAVQLMTRYIQQNNAVLISGGTSSSTSVALAKLGQRAKVLFFAGVSGSNATTDKDCQRYSFRSQNPAYMVGAALAPVLAEKIGKKMKAVYLVPDYTYGHSLADSTAKATEAVGWTTVQKVVCPVGASDYSPYLINIANSGADVFVNTCYSGDSVNSSKQAQEFGILKKMRMVVPNISPFQAKSLGPEIMGGVYGTLPFWWKMAEMNELAKIFVTTYEQRYGSKPRWAAHAGYLQMFLWAEAVNRAGTFYPPEIIKTLEKEKHMQTTLGEFYYRACDHQGIRGVPVVVGKRKDEMKGKDDYYHILHVTPGEKVSVPCSALQCKMGSYT